MITNADPQACLAPYRDEVREAIERVLASGRYILGPEVEAFEHEFAVWGGPAHCVSVANGTDAIELALRAVGVKSGDGVVVPANTVSATLAGVISAGARPVFGDVDPDTMCLSPARLAALLDSPRGAGVKAIVPVHLYGQPCAIGEIVALAGLKGLRVVEDCAQAHGAVWEKRKVGAWGDAAAFSFYPTKNLAALGDGGAVLTGDQSVANELRALRQYGWRERYVSVVDGTNSRLDEMQAAILRVRLRHLDRENYRRRQLAEIYFQRLARAPLRLPPHNGDGVLPVFHQFVVRTPRREALRAWLAARGIVAQVLYPVPAHAQPAFAPFAPRGPGELAACEQACAEVLSLPVHPGLTEAQVETVAGAVLDWCAAGQPLPAAK